MTRKIFITATDTDAGKTLISAAITCIATKYSNVSCFKPVSAGCDVINGQLINEDAAILQKAANTNQRIEQVNPIAFVQPIAPHIAAKTIDSSISVNQIIAHYNDLLFTTPDVVITEGAGGWRLPLGNNQFLSDFAKQTQQEVILVVNMKLGCLNHAILTYESIISDGLNCVGWVANCIEQMPYLEENIVELKAILPAPCLGVIPHVEHYTQATGYLDLSTIFS